VWVAAGKKKVVSCEGCQKKKSGCHPVGAEAKKRKRRSAKDDDEEEDEVVEEDKKGKRVRRDRSGSSADAEYIERLAEELAERVSAKLGDRMWKMVRWAVEQMQDADYEGGDTEESESEESEDQELEEGELKGLEAEKEM
jgi:hypothetical protein